ncbi:HigA family addiction module antitoxin [Limnobacter sp. MED105]|uniref:HigA family addiction module antitoxin n=1 Tax=Limnobacter sp. MED105 TaxID=391597 RepID=UPI000156C584|nr:putative proteic killer active protein [Limnobacter sp. MED105]
MEMFNPPHPGGILKDDVLPAMGLTVSEASVQIGVDRVTLSRFLNEKSSLSVSMALKLEGWLGQTHGGAAEVWLKMQLAYDLWHARQNKKAA